VSSLPESLPSTWATVQLRDLGQWVGGGTPSKTKYGFWAAGNIPWLSPKDVKMDFIMDSEDHVTQEAIDAGLTTLVPADSVVVVARSGILANTLPVATTGRAVAINQDLKVLVPAPGIASRYVAYALKRFEKDILSTCTKSGTTVSSILSECLLSFAIPIAPSVEQHIIVKRIDALMERVGQVALQSAAVRAQLRSLREFAFQLAFRGAATRKWRRDNPSAANLRASSIAAGAKDLFERQSSGAALTERSNAFHLAPDVHWEIVPLQDVCDMERGITYGIIQTGEHVPNGVPTVRAGDIKDFAIDTDSLKRVRPDRSAQYSRTVLRGGEVLVSIRGTTGNVAVATREMRGMNVSREVAVIPTVRGVNPYYVAFALASPTGQAIITQHVKGVAQSGINLRDLRQFPLPLPSEREQDEIVAFLTQVLERADAISEHIDAAETLCRELRESILRAAFHGKLTTRNENDESAHALVEKLRITRATQPSAARQLRRQSPKGILSGKTRREDVVKTRKDVEPDYLHAIVSKASESSMEVKDVYWRAEMEIGEFYKQLASELAMGRLRQSVDKTRLATVNAP
jgi:type I restriction enzyme, S subunit